MLTAAQLDQLRNVLEAERKRLLQTAHDALSYAMNREPSLVGRDSIDESMEEEIFSTELRLRDREKFLLGKVMSALGRLEEGTIDECDSCGEQIGFRRLMARPVTSLCIDCKEEAEKEEQMVTQARGMGLRDESGLGDEGVEATED